MTPPVILVVDDNPTNLLLITEVLTWEGYVVEPASDAPSAQSVLDRMHPDLILMDIGLPGMDGLAFTRQLKADPRTRSIPIAAVTASAMKGDDERVFAAGCDAYVTKPIDATALIQTIARLLKRPISPRADVNPALSPVPVTSARTSTEHVLIADDFAPNRLLLRDILEADGFRVSESSDGLEALAILEREPVDAVISDVLMPNIDGFRLCMEIRRNHRLKSLPFIVYTSTYSSSADKALAAKVGADHYLVKPSPAPVVVATIRNAIKAGSARSTVPVVDDEMGVIKQYNEALVAKLEKKHEDLSRALAELQESVEFSRQIIAGAREGVAVFDRDLRYRVFNPCMEEMTQLAAPAVIGKTPADVLPAERAAPLQARLHRALAGEVAHSEDQFVLPQPDQPGRWIASKASPLRDARGAIVGVIVVVSDITERKHAENALRESETRFRQLAENIEEVLWITDPTKSEMLFISPAYERIWLRSCTTLYTDPRTWIDAIHPEDRSRVLTAAEEKQVLGTYDEVYRIVRTDGTLRWIRDRAFPIRDGDGRVYRIAGIAEDITVRREAEAALRESEERYRRLIDDVRDAVFTLREDGLITSLNPAFETITGYACGEWIGKLFWPLVDASDRDRAGAQFLRVLQGERTDPFEIKIRKKDGSTATVEFSSSRQDAGGRTSVVGIGRDITERKRLAAQFLQAQKIEAIGTLAGGIAHDFNNILTGINGYLELARLTAGDNDELKDYLDAALSGGMRAADLIRQIMAFSRQEDAQRRPIFLHYVVSEALRLLRPTIPTTIDVATELDQEAPAVLADPTQVHQIVMNLATNAWHAMKDKPGRLQITVKRTRIADDARPPVDRMSPGDYCCVSVRDTGHGMTPQTLERIFEPFFTTKPRGEGTGLGLSAVHGIMQNHGGHIRVTSQPGQGSCFELYFPAHEAGRHDADSIDSQVNRGQGEAVLFVDDEAFLVRLASRLLESLGYTPYATTDAQEALDLVRAQPDRFRVVVTDLTMPGLTGIDLAQELFKISPGLPIILTTGYSADWTEERLKALGLYEILPKPPTREALARAVERALQRRAKEAHGRHPRSATCGVLPPTLKARQSRAPHDSSMSLAPASRRRFLQQSALLIAAPLILPGRVWSQASAPSKRLTIGCIGMGHQMNGHLGNFLNRDDVQVVAVCDVDTTRREYTKKRVNDFYAAKTGTEYKGCDAYNDFRELLARKDIDIAVIATPDHWHAYIAIAAVKAGKDVYCEKPLTYSVREAVELVKAVRSTQRVFQTGSQQRSSKEFRVAAELVRNGVIGKVSAINVSFGDPAKPYAEPVEAMEPGLDWKLWCGPGPLVGYSPYLSPRGVHKHFPHWRNTWEFGGGMITDWGAHHIDIAQWALNADESGPVEIRAPQNWETAKRGAQLIYADGTVLTHIRGRGVSFYGTEGEIHVNRGKFEFILDQKTVHKFWDKEVDKTTSLDREVILTQREFLADAKVKLYESSSHFQDFVNAVKSRQRPICDVAIGASSVIACHLMNFAYHYGANAKWNPAKNRFVSGGNSKWLARERTTKGWEV